jgi:hypothetical protein
MPLSVVLGRRPGYCHPEGCFFAEGFGSVPIYSGSEWQTKARSFAALSDDISVTSERFALFVILTVCFSPEGSRF